MTGQKQKIMRRFALDEISAVTNPAQKGARMTIMKRDDTSERELERARKDAIAKGQTVITSSANGHAHLIVLDDYTLARGGGYTDEVAELVGERSRWHRHPFVIDKKGSITIGHADGHSHSVEMVKADGDDGVSDELSKGRDSTMTQEEFARLEAIASLTDLQKDHYYKMKDGGDSAGADAFLKMSRPDRQAAVEKAAKDAADKSGGADNAALNKGSDPALTAVLAKLDEMSASNAALQAVVGQLTEKSKDAEVEALVAKMGHIGKPLDEKRTLAKGILAITDENARNAALEVLTKGASDFAHVVKNFGIPHAGPGMVGEPVDKINELAREYAKTAGVSIAKAVDHVVTNTPEGRSLYAETVH